MEKAKAKLGGIFATAVLARFRNAVGRVLGAGDQMATAEATAAPAALKSYPSSGAVEPAASPALPRVGAPPAIMGLTSVRVPAPAPPWGSLDPTGSTLPSLRWAYGLGALSLLLFALARRLEKKRP